jgi:hypothetical protein
MVYEFMAILPYPNQPINYKPYKPINHPKHHHNPAQQLNIWISDTSYAFWPVASG